MSAPTPPRSGADVLRRFAEIIGTGDYDALEEVMAADCHIEYPQSGEVIPGRENLKQILLHYPGGGPTTNPQRTLVMGGDEHYVMTPTFNLVKVSGAGDTVGAVIESQYSDGSTWFITSFATLESGKMVKVLNLFAPHFDPPEWRRQWVELSEDA